ncbi:cell division protein FtsZ [Kaistella antarctica]|uniref:Cell division protein FtsZ n=1 Tax=Kaistella antarctica TaxID=266748 RepID=A0A448NTA8_9FLAO|nr:cell division protein FtsZ [Kaistella antarctica]KEY18089.1 cell division protein FtsZ [Kaistella antarctica]SEV82640.1 cell division protein FtsZ [Kaistella antarctica]VEI00680.1 Cell division protein FtsZ [Kaistella antarctica]
MENINTPGFSFDLPKGNSSIIKVIGVGGGGNNALKHMYERGIHGVDFVICNTDSQTLDNNPVANKVQLGLTITEGLGAGADPEVGEKAAIESIEDIKAAMGQNTKMVFITAGMGGGTGTGAAPVIAKVAKDMGILTIGIVTVPFSFEGKRRLEQAELGLEKLRNNVDSLIVINNDKLRQQFGNLGFKSGFSKADEVLTNAAKGMAEVITGYFDVNIDFRDAKSVLANSGTALMSNGVASGENKAEEAVKKALDSPLLNDNKITGARNVLLLIRSGTEEVTMDEIGVIMDHIQIEAGHTADIIFGVGTDEELGDSVSVLVIATGFSKEHQKTSGVTEKVNFTLSDSIEPAKKRENIFKSNLENQETAKSNSPSKNLFILDDEDDFPVNEFQVKTVEKKRVIEKEVPTDHNRFVEENQSPENFLQEEESPEFDLFTYDDDLSDEPLAQSFSFETEDKKEETPFKNTPTFTEEKPMDFSFFVNEPIEEPIVETPQPTAIIKEEPVQKVEPKVEEPVAETNLFDVEDDFTFINKTPNSDKVLERRNKLKQFNSRYQNFEPENDFETIPAFRRKNISIGQENASDQKINNFLTETDGKMQVRENRFLNKDVD